MNLKRVIDIYNIIKERLPKTYPRPKLAFFEDEESMLVNQNMKLKDYENVYVYAVVNPETLTINLPLTMKLEHTDSKGKVVYRTVPLNKMSEEDIAHTILHEIGHLYAGDRYGYFADQYFDEKYCDAFAERWIKVLCKDKLL